MKERAKEILEKYYNIAIKNNPNKRWIDFGDNIEEVEFILNASLEFATEMCELQKIECANNSEADFNILNQNGSNNYSDIEAYVLKQSILQCKNVVDSEYKDKIIVEVEGGIARCEDSRVEIIDYDNLEDI